MSDIEKFKRHLGKPVKFVLTNEEGEEDEFSIKPLNMEQYATMIYLSSKFKEGLVIDKEAAKEFTDLMYDILKNSYPEIDSATLKQFVPANFNQLSEQIPKILPGTLTEEEKKSIREKLKKK